jgi:hypothetical protein
VGILEAFSASPHRLRNSGCDAACGLRQFAADGDFAGFWHAALNDLAKPAVFFEPDPVRSSAVGQPAHPDDIADHQLHR